MILSTIATKYYWSLNLYCYSLVLSYSINLYDAMDNPGTIMFITYCTKFVTLLLRIIVWCIFKRGNGKLIETLFYYRYLHMVSFSSFENVFAKSRPIFLLKKQSTYFNIPVYIQLTNVQGYTVCTIMILKSVFYSITMCYKDYGIRITYHCSTCI